MARAKIDPRYTNLRHLFAKAIPDLTLNEIRPALRYMRSDRVRPGTLTFIDVGAHYGLWSAAAVNLLGPMLDKVHAFEPLPGNFDRIQKLVDRQIYGGFIDKLRFNNHALGKASGTETLYSDKDESLHASTAMRKIKRAKSLIDLSHAQDVRAMTLDDYCGYCAIEHIDVLRVSAVGAELDVLMGAKKTLAAKAVSVVVFDFGAFQNQLGQSFSDFWNFFEPLDFDLHLIKRQGRPSVPLTELTDSHDDYAGQRLFMATARSELS